MQAKEKPKLPKDYKVINVKTGKILSEKELETLFKIEPKKRGTVK